MLLGFYKFLYLLRQNYSFIFHIFHNKLQKSRKQENKHFDNEKQIKAQVHNELK